MKRISCQIENGSGFAPCGDMGFSTGIACEILAMMRMGYINQRQPAKSRFYENAGPPTSDRRSRWFTKKNSA